MRIVFGMSADGRAYPEYPGAGPGSLGASVVGPSGLLDLLSIQLGLTRPAVSPIVRVATWLRKLEAAAGERFWSASLAADPWSTARLVLSWRDTLVESGWHPALLPSATGRLRDFADAETGGPLLPTGRADLLWEVVARLEAGDAIEFEHLLLLDPDLPPGWQRLVEALAARQVTVDLLASEPAADASTDLGRAQRFLAGAPVDPVQGDGSIVEINAGTTIMAAEMVAEWVAHGDTSAIDTVIVSPDGNTSLIDRALTKRGLPKLGLSPRSPHRGTLQLLPLAFATAWKPFDPARLLELLLLPRAPIPRSVSWRFVRALERRPGRAAVLDDELWAAIIAALEAQDPHLDPATIADQTTRWRSWLDVGHLDPAEGITVLEALEICKRVRDWALAAAAGHGDPLLASVVGAGDALVDSLIALDKERVSRLQLERMIEQAIDEGLADPELYPEAGSLRAIDCPGALWGPVRNVIWWNFAGKAATDVWPWSEAEYGALTDAGCAPERPERRAQRQEADWRRTVSAATERLLLVRTTHHNGEETTSHPLSHRLSPLLHPESGPSVARIEAEVLLGNTENICVERRIERVEAEVGQCAAPRAVWRIDAKIEDRLTERRESATSLEDLASCQLKWLLKHVVRLMPGSLAEVPRPNQLFGNLAHAIAQDVFPSGAVPDPALVEARAREVFDRFVEEIAAPLLQPALAGELAFARIHLPTALAVLAGLLAERGLVVEGMEEWFEQDVDGVRLNGRLDMRVRTATGPAVVDLKWAGEKKRRGQLKDGRAIQLATYGRLLDPAGGIPAGYYIVDSRTLLVEPDGPLPGEVVRPDRSLDDTWNAVVADWRLWLDGLRQGTLVAGGLPGAAEAVPAGLTFETGEAACTYCEYRGVCRVGAEEVAA